ncbi:hypothetical protein BD414DRAFT_119601 [Trametes punicea]|nr:hypothetical protein BD414DRAFT_119601 [Trametes punicea]
MLMTDGRTKRSSIHPLLPWRNHPRKTSHSLRRLIEGTLTSSLSQVKVEARQRRHPQTNRRTRSTERVRGLSLVQQTLPLLLLPKHPSRQLSHLVQTKPSVACAGAFRYLRPAATSLSPEPRSKGQVPRGPSHITTPSLVRTVMAFPQARQGTMRGARSWVMTQTERMTFPPSPRPSEARWNTAIKNFASASARSPSASTDGRRATSPTLGIL